MQISQDSFIPILFNVLFGFVALNIVVNLILLYTRRLRIYKLLAIFWPTVLGMFILDGFFQASTLQIIYSYSSGMIPGLIGAMIVFELVNRSFPLKAYVLSFLPLYPLTYWLSLQGLSFTLVALPFSIAMAIPFLHGFLILNIIDFQKTTKLQKVLGCVYLGHALHCLNFALFRMDPGSQLWGWLVSYVLCDLLAILLPSIALELATLSEKEKLLNLVNEKTFELKKSLKTNESLLKVLLHDMSNPLMVMRGYLNLLKEDRGNKEVLIARTEKAQQTMEEIISQMRKAYFLKNRSPVSLSPVVLDSCFKEISFIFDQLLEHKNISLSINCELAPGTCVLADYISLTHSVLSNIISNGIKFNPPESKIYISVKEDPENVTVEIKDQGPGMPESVILAIMRNKEPLSTEGTSGEQGSGLGLSIVKSFVDSYGGQIEFISKHMNGAPQDIGTNIRITLKKALAS